MKAIVNEKYGSPDILEYREVETPKPKSGEVLIKIYAAGVNAADWRLLRAKPFLARFESGMLKPKNKILGADFSGVVKEVGEGVTKFKKGDEVFGDLSANNFGTFAEYVAAPESMISLKPKNLSFEQAAAVPMSAVTALQGLRKGGIKKGMKVLINGASGGVGTYSLQIAKTLGAEVTAVCGPDSQELARELGADFVIDYTKEDFSKSEKKYDLIVGVNGSNSLSTYKRGLVYGGTYVMSGGGNKQLFEAIFLGAIVFAFGGKKIQLLMATPSAEDLEFIKSMIEENKIKPIIDRTYKLSEVADAIRYIEKGHAKGKVVILVEGK